MRPRSAHRDVTSGGEHESDSIPGKHRRDEADVGGDAFIPNENPGVCDRGCSFLLSSNNLPSLLQQLTGPVLNRIHRVSRGGVIGFIILNPSSR